LDVELGEGAPDLLEPVQLALGPVAELAHLALAAVLDLAADVALGALGLELGQVGSSFCARASTSASRRCSTRLRSTTISFSSVERSRGAGPC
jgi:hypothetical protein